MELSGDWSGGLPIRALCIAADEEAPDGRLPVPSTDTLEAVLGWKGRKDRGEEALLEAGLIAKDETGYRIVDWEVDQGHILKFHQRAKKAARALWRRDTVDATSNAISNAISISEGRHPVG